MWITPAGLVACRTASSAASALGIAQSHSSRLVPQGRRRTATVHPLGMRNANSDERAWVSGGLLGLDAGGVATLRRMRRKGSACYLLRDIICLTLLTKTLPKNRLRTELTALPPLPSSLGTCASVWRESEPATATKLVLRPQVLGGGRSPSSSDDQPWHDKDR